MNETLFDLVIVGAGPGGYVSAIRGAHQGLKVALIEEKDLGGVCLHTGCIPTKTMVASVGLLRQARAASQWGVNVAQAEAQLSAIIARRQKVVQQLAGGVKTLLEKNGVTVIIGRGTLKSANEIEVKTALGQQTVKSNGAIMLATGSRPFDLPVARRDGVSILNSDDILVLNELPEELLIIGGGYIGCEFASIFAALGSKVTIIEGLSRLVPNMDKELGQWLERSFKKAGINLLLNARVEQATASNGVEVRLADGQVIKGSKVLVAVGRVPNVEGLGLEEAGVKLNGRFIGVDEFMATSAAGVYAVGDVTGKMMLAHVASGQGRVVVENLIAAKEGKPERHKMNYDAIPACVFTYPEIATIGLSEEEALARGISVKVGKFPFAAIGKALAMGETEGFVKLIAHAETGKLVGGHIFGGHAAELIGQVTLAISLGATAQQLTETIFAHPTLSESILEASEALFGKATHIYTRR